MLDGMRLEEKRLEGEKRREDGIDAKLDHIMDDGRDKLVESIGQV